METILKSLPTEVQRELYKDPWTCQAIFRSLSSLAKQYLLRVLFLLPGQPLPNMLNWVKESEQKLHKDAIESLLELGIFERPDEKNVNHNGNGISQNGSSASQAIRLNVQFQRQLQLALAQCGEEQFNFPKEQLKPDKRAPTLAALDEYSANCWESLLQFIILIDTGESKYIPPENIISLLVQTNILEQNNKNRLSITPSGYQFLLKDTYTQIWTLLLSYISNTKMKTETLSLLFRLSFLTFGKDYPVSWLTPTQQQVLNDLRTFGLAYQRKKSSRRFYPTRLATLLSSSSSSSSSLHSLSATSSTLPAATTNKGYIILEQNYRLYAYTTSSLHLAILSLFCTIRYQLPGFVMGLISRESIRKALLHGITAEQVISYIKQNLHKDTATHYSGVPETVADQIRLWESERKRVSYQPGVLYEQFANQEQFDKVVMYAKDLDVLRYEDKTHRKIIVAESAHETVRAYIKRHFG